MNTQQAAGWLKYHVAVGTLVTMYSYWVHGKTGPTPFTSVGPLVLDRTGGTVTLASDRPGPGETIDLVLSTRHLVALVEDVRSAKTIVAFLDEHGALFNVKVEAIEVQDEMVGPMKFRIFRSEAGPVPTGRRVTAMFALESVVGVEQPHH